MFEIKLLSAFLSFVISKTLSRGWGQQTKSLPGKHKHETKQKLDKAKTKVKKRKKSKLVEYETEQRRRGNLWDGWVFFFLGDRR